MASKSFKFGKAFKDQFYSVSRSTKHLSKARDALDWQDTLVTQQTQTIRIGASLSDWHKLFLIAGFLFAFALLATRLFHLQIAEGSRNHSLADSNRIAVRAIHAPRGVIYDRNGKILAQNEPGYRLLDASGSGQTKYLTRDEGILMEVNNDPRLKDLEIDNLRYYPYGEVSAHLLGYISEISADELKEVIYQNYKPGDNIGRGGIEQSYEKVLRGTDGGEIIEVDAAGNKLGTLGKNLPTPGQNIYLTIDADLQKVAFDQLKKEIEKGKDKVCCGAVVVQDPRNGQVLAMVSYPSFDSKKLADAFANSNSPILNRAIGGIYPPGSTFKVLTALAGLNSGRITPETQYEDTGIMYLGPYSFANWYYTQHGAKEQGGVDVVKALKRSNDIFFYHLGQQVGEQIMGDEAKKMGFGKTTGIDIPGEEAGLIPDNQWKIDNIGEVWYPGDSLHMSIGQGYVLSTPLQVSSMISAVAMNGVQYIPHLAQRITTPSGKTVKQYNYDGSKPLYSPEYYQLIKTALEQVPQTGGTAWPFFNFPIKTAGKTGTAEYGHPDNRTHAWYTTYAPADKPEIAVTVLIESGGEGSTNASPVAREILRWYFSPDKQNLIKDLSPTATNSGVLLQGD